MDTLQVISRKNIDSVFSFPQHVQSSTLDTEVIFKVHLTAQRETDTIRFSKPRFAGMDSTGSFLYRRDTLRLSKNYYGNVLLNFDPGDTLHRLVMKCDTFSKVSDVLNDMRLPGYFFSGNTEFICRYGKIRTNHWCMDGFQPTLNTNDWVEITTDKEIMHGRKLRIDDLFLSSYTITEVVDVYPLSPEKP